MSVSAAAFWLKCACIILLIIFGLVFALAANPVTAGPATSMLDGLMWPIDGAQSLAARETRIISAIGGGITVGWGILVWMIVDRLMPENPQLARVLLMRSLIVWFVVDSIASFMAGVPQNVAMNVLFLLAFLYPLLRMDRR